MKNVLMILGLAIGLVSCGGGTATEGTELATEVATTVTTSVTPIDLTTVTEVADTTATDTTAAE